MKTRMNKAIEELEQAFRRIHRERMSDVPILNHALEIEAIGFQTWGEAWLGVLVTPWFMNLVLLPKPKADWTELKPTTSTIERFPAGDLEFLVANQEEIGPYKTCTLFSDTHIFIDQDAARVAAEAAMDALIYPKPPEPPKRPDISRRAFLRGDFQGKSS